MSTPPDIEFTTLTGDLKMSTFTVTNEQFATFLAGGGYQDARWWTSEGWAWRTRLGINQPSYWMQPEYVGPLLPVTGVCLYEAQAYAAFVGADLPTEAEWEFACYKGGRTRYPWGNDARDIPVRRANLSFFGALRPAALTAVNAFPEGRSAAGVWDLLGNVSPWCMSEQGVAVLRGGCAWHTPEAVDCHFRDLVNPEVRDNQTCIRLVRRRRALVTPPSSAPPVTPPPRRPIARPTRPFRQEGIPTNLDPTLWALRVTGAVAEPRVFTLDDLTARLPQSRRRGLYTCVCRWAEVNDVAGVLLADLMSLVRPTRPAESLFVVQRSVPGPPGRVYNAAVLLADALANDAILCHTLDGHTLTHELGWPLRLIAFHLYGYKQLKALAELHLTEEFESGWWEQEMQYDPEGVIQPGTVTVIGNKPHRLEIAHRGAVPVK